MNVHNPTIKKLLHHYKEISMLNKIKALLDWDVNVNLPPKASQARASQTAYVSETITNLWFTPSFKTDLEKAQSIEDLTEEEKAIVRNLKYNAKYYYKVPKDLIVKKDKVTSEAFTVWKEAREKNEYKKFFPYLKQIIEIDRTIAQHLGYKDNPYDALLDLYEPELTASFTEKTFTELKKHLVTLLHHIQHSKHYSSEHLLINGEHTYSLPQQKRLTEFLMEKMQFDFAAGRVDESPHPFTTSLDRYDIRVTTRYKEKNIAECISVAMHETGHALYEQNVNPSYDNTPLEHGVSLGIHESLSRFWENMIGKDPNFLHFLTPVLQGYYPEQLNNIDPQEVTKMSNLVKPSLIRIEADEVTYSLHIILRFEMENALINGTIQPEAAADAWREKSQELLGIQPTTDSEGIMQDVHWTYGAIGYFPAYALGNLYGAQFLAAMKKDINFDTELKEGNLTPIKSWLDKHIHQYGSLYFPKELVKRVTGEELNAKYFVKYLENKYKKIYGL